PRNGKRDKARQHAAQGSHCAPHGKAPRRGVPSRSRVRRPATEQTGCGAEGVVAAASPRFPPRDPFAACLPRATPRPPVAGGRARRRAHPPRRTNSLAMSLALSLAPPAAAAAQTTDLDNVVVTATRTAITADASLAAVEVIDRD